MDNLEKAEKIVNEINELDHPTNEWATGELVIYDFESKMKTFEVADPGFRENQQYCILSDPLVVEGSLFSLLIHLSNDSEGEKTLSALI